MVALKTMRVYIARHGQPWLSQNWEEDPEFPRGDPPLSDLGRTQARLLGVRLRELGFRGKIYASPYYRTAETAELVARELSTVFYPEAAIREVVKESAKMVGFNGMTLDALQAEFGSLSRSASLPYPWWTGQAETPEMVLARVGRFLAARDADDEDFMIVGHGASVSAGIRYYLADYPDILAGVENNWNCGLTAIQVKPEFLAHLLSDFSHLAPDQVTSNAKTRRTWLEEKQAHGQQQEGSWDLTQ